MFKLNSEFFAPSDITGGAGSGSGPSIEEKSLSKEGIIDFLADDEVSPEDVLDLENKGGKSTLPKADKEVPEDDKEIEEGTEESDETEDTDKEEDELAELEKELEGPTDEQLELVTPVRRKEILTKYPTLFKDFPYLEKAYYREQQFTELFPTIDEAKDAQEAVGTLNRFEQEVLDGRTTTILKSVKETNPESFNKIVDNYLVALKDTDEMAYYHVLGNISKNTIVAMVQESRRTGNEALQSAATILNQFLFGSTEFQRPTNLSKEENPQDKGREDKVAKREQEFTQRQFESTRGELNTRVNSTITRTIEANIDPKGSMSGYLKGAAIREVTEGLQRLTQKDVRFTALADKLWDAAFKDGFSQTSKDRIRQAYLSKAKTVLPALIKQARINALRGVGRRVSSEEVSQQEPRKGPVASGGRPRSQQSSGKIKTAADIPRGMKTIDFLNSD